jgi:hypothetical protein
MPFVPITIPPVGKSGPLTISHSSASETLESSSTVLSALQTSRRLCGGSEVAMPTAMPSEPLQSRFGKRPGSTTGCIRVPS